MKLYSLYLSEPQKDKIERIAKDKGLKTSELLRRIIDAFVEKEENKSRTKIHKP